MELVEFNNIPIKNHLEVIEDFQKLPSTISLKVHIKGNLVNGFIDSHFVCIDNKSMPYQIWIPDPVTYLSEFYHMNGNIVTIRRGLDTGILQRNIDEVIELQFKISDFGRETIDGHSYYVNKGDEIDRIEIDIWVDPFHLPNQDRTKIEKQTITIRNKTT